MEVAGIRANLVGLDFSEESFDQAGACSRGGAPHFLEPCFAVFHSIITMKDSEGGKYATLKRL
jgi:hypothetical protein